MEILLIQLFNVVSLPFCNLSGGYVLAQCFFAQPIADQNHSGFLPFGDGNFGANVIVIWKANPYSTHFKIQTLIHKETFVSNFETKQSNTHVELN